MDIADDAKGGNNMARRMNPGSLAALVLAIAVLVLVGGSYLVSSRLNRDAETVGNSASAPNAPGRINEQPASTATSRTQNQPPPLTESNVPPAGGQKQ
jgi:hypothetical protein